MPRPSARRTVSVAVVVDAPARTAWEVVTDWEGQGAWMPATRVRRTAGDGRSVGTRLEAVTGYGPASFTDTMELLVWEPPRRCVVAHTGGLVHGEGVVEVVPLPDGRSRVVWLERLDLPLGALGRLAWPVVHPFAHLGLLVALRRMARIAARR